jgi:hypothetical protein
MTNKVVGKWLRNIRTSNFLSQKEFGKLIFNKTSRTVRRLENEEADLTINELVNIITYFYIDPQTAILEILESNFFYKYKKRLQRELRKSMNGTENIEIILMEIHLNNDYEKFNENEKNYIDIIESFVLCKKNEDTSFLKYFFKEYDVLVLDDLLLLRWALAIMEIEDIINVIEKIDFENVKNMNLTVEQSELYVLILLNSIGFLIERGYDDFEYILYQCEKCHEIILQYEQIHLLILIFRHKAYLYKKVRNEELYIKMKNDSLNLAEILKKEKTLGKLLEEYRKWEGLKDYI